jgi:hypothetical protein
MATSDQLEQQLQRWTVAGILDSESAGRIREFESAHESPGVRWPVIFAIAFGSIMVAAGVLLFVAAHWDDLSPTQRFLLVLTMIAGFHLAGGMLMPRFRALGLSLHAIGTVALGGGIYLAGQIFNLQEHWPGAGLGSAGKPPRAHQCRRGRICLHHHGLLFLRRDGQTRPLGRSYCLRSSLPGRRMATGAASPQTGRAHQNCADCDR